MWWRFYCGRSENNPSVSWLYHTSTADVIYLFHYYSGTHATVKVHPLYGKGTSWFQRQPRLNFFALLRFGFWELENEIWHGCASCQDNNARCWTFFIYFFGCWDTFFCFFWIFRRLWLSLIHEIKKKKKKSNTYGVRLVMMHNHAKVRFPTLKNQSAKMIPVKRNFSPQGFPKAQYIVLVLWQTCFMSALYSSQNKTSTTNVFSLLIRSCQHVYRRIIRRIDRFMTWRLYIWILV